MANTSAFVDLAGKLHLYPHYWHTQARINYLVDRYLSLDNLSDRLNDLPLQFDNPQPRPWQPIDWQAIAPDQIIGIAPDVFLAILEGIADTEAPIRSYAQVSRRYLEKFHPQLAKFVGGKVASEGSPIELGLWEKEERQHTPAVVRAYFQLTGKKLTPNLQFVRDYQPSDDPYTDTYSHGLHRVMTEYSAVCLYIWLMAHTTGPLQQVFAELVRDEANHTIKFLGFGVWAFPDAAIASPQSIFRQLVKLGDRDRGQCDRSGGDSLNLGGHTVRIARTFRRMMDVLGWHSWSSSNKAELAFAFVRIMHQLLRWRKTLTPEYLQQLLGVPPMPSPQQLSRFPR